MYAVTVTYRGARYYIGKNNKATKFDTKEAAKEAVRLLKDANVKPRVANYPKSIRTVNFITIVNLIKNS